MRRWLAALVLLQACNSAQTATSSLDPALELLAIHSVAPQVIVPGSTLVVDGRSFVEEPWGKSYIRLDGAVGGSPVHDLYLDAQFLDYDRLEVAISPDTFDDLGGDDATFAGTATVVVDSGVDGKRYSSSPLAVEIDLRSRLQPQVTSVQTEALAFVNGRVSVDGDGFLLGGDEGDTMVELAGYFDDGSGSEIEVGPVTAVLTPNEAFSRAQGVFLLPPELVGISAGSFHGSAMFYNQHLSGEKIASPSPANIEFDLIETTVYGVSPARLSLGQYLHIEGGGFLADGATTVRIQGTFTPSGEETIEIDDLVEVVPSFVDGAHMRYVLNEEDLPIDPRRDHGIFEGVLVPIVAYDGQELVGESTEFAIEIAPVKQVVYLRFTNGFVEALRDFGLRAAERQVRDRVMEVVARDYATVNLEVRSAIPEDFELFAEVEVGGPDPQGIGLLGYDNTPGKDVGNMRLHDRLGGVNAQTQQDGYPGYGGVFVESLFAFSKRPPRGITSVSGADSTFDVIFDPFRPDRGGRPIRAADLQYEESLTIDTAQCPASERPDQVRCAVTVLGNLIGTTLAHEIGHSLGLANPYGSGFHNPYDEPNRLMDSGSARPFAERAELFGQGPGRFCDDEYDYLRRILPTDEPTDPTPRPRCN